MTKFLLPLLLLVSAQAFANGPWYRAPQDMKFPSQVILERFAVTAPAVGSAQSIGSTTSLTAGKTLSTFTNQPDFPRNIVIAFTGTTGSIAAGNIVIAGTNIFGKTISETIAITNGTTKTGSTAFKTLTSIVFPTTTGSNGDVTYTMTAGDKLGVHRCADLAGKYAFSIFDGAYETTRGTFAADATHVELNTFIPNGTMNGSKNVEMFFIENFRCYPY